MNTSTVLVLLSVFACTFLVIGVGIFLHASHRPKKSNELFKARTMLTANELEFLNRLESAVPELRFCPQVSMGALLDPAVSRKDRRNFLRIRGMFAQKIIDFVAQDRESGAVVALIELDDRTHDQLKDSKRDAMANSAGYFLIRWASQNKPDAETIRRTLLNRGAL
jgi:Protein of unknown function (DUF2726)